MKKNQSSLWRPGAETGERKEGLWKPLHCVLVNSGSISTARWAGTRCGSLPYGLHWSRDGFNLRVHYHTFPVTTCRQICHPPSQLVNCCGRCCIAIMGLVVKKRNKLGHLPVWSGPCRSRQVAVVYLSCYRFVLYLINNDCQPIQYTRMPIALIEFYRVEWFIFLTT